MASAPGPDEARVAALRQRTPPSGMRSSLQQQLAHYGYGILPGVAPADEQEPPSVRAFQLHFPTQFWSPGNRIAGRPGHPDGPAGVLFPRTGLEPPRKQTKGAVPCLRDAAKPASDPLTGFLHRQAHADRLGQTVEGGTA